MFEAKDTIHGKSQAARIAFCALMLAAAAADGFAAECDDTCQQQLAAARQATAAYHDDAVAVADGFAPDPICIGLPGVGAMGIHYFNAGRAADAQVAADEPEVLLYEPRSDGGRRLVGVEYFAPVFSNGAPWFGDATQPPPVVDNPAPVLFGQTFQGPMPGHGPGMPWHYDLHVWAWRHNPAGLFSLLNPKVACE